MMEYRVEAVDDENAERWDRFNEASPEGSIFHSLKWKRIVDATLNDRTRYFLISGEDTVVGIVPFIEHHHGIFHGLIPAQRPQRLYAIFKDYHDPAYVAAIIRKAKKGDGTSRKACFVSIAVRHEEVFDTIRRPPVFPGISDGDMVLDLCEHPPDAIWSGFTARSGQRKKIRRFAKHGYEIIEVQSLEQLHDFYRYYEENIRHIGASAVPFSHMESVWNSLSPEDFRITLLAKGSLIAGGKFMFLDRAHRTMYSTYLSLNRNIPTTFHPYYALTWESIEWAWDNHFEKVSLGAQQLDPDNPRYRIKFEFGARYVPTITRTLPLSNGVKLGMLARRYVINR